MTKNQEFFQKVNEAFASGDVDFLMENLAEDIQWEMVGNQKIQGKESVMEMLEPMRGVTLKDYVTNNIITHGNVAVIEGKMTVPDDGKDKTYAFCDIYKLHKFKNGKIKELTAFLIEVDEA
ncbi:Ketosteroid isomerase-related protein [Lentibacillus halodurans]|uniref:Ketosteroid isomerase-related protein n=1 Tax=Lentibacillus halodurans TaxID=237679 RepID=A0A1I0W6M8_9BACI|nr:nuclear transport factor 2 family protein [Lentibacillus halodurans]SFA84342.1 Ketosteroid isomerase-related protein [Lentibacillus halodurans]